MFSFVLELIGTVAFAVSGAALGWKQEMDMFGVVMLSLITSVGGGMLRDITLGITPPAVFTNPALAVTALIVSVISFIPFVYKWTRGEHNKMQKLLFASDSVGLGIFTVSGAAVAIASGYGENEFLVIFAAVRTGVGGGVLRDIMAG